jgi:hypothetical protein
MRQSPRTQRYRLLGGPYAAPECRVGRKLYCKRRRRWVKVGGLTDAPVSWPFVQGGRSLILCGDLARAVREESASAVAAHWGVGRKLVWQWRKALGVTEYTPGTCQLIKDTIPEKVDLARLAQARAAAMTPESRAKMSATRKGRRPNEAFMEAARVAARRPKSESFRTKLSERLKREWASGTRRPHPPGRPWEAGEIARLGQAPDVVVAREIGRSPAAVQKARLRLGIPCPPAT